MSEITPFGSLPSGTSWPESFGWCGHNPVRFSFEAGSLHLRLCATCYGQVGQAWLQDLLGVEVRVK